MNLIKTTTVASLLLVSGMTSAVELTGNIALTTDYVWRGVSLSDNAPAIQGGFDADFGNGIYAGIWGSNVDGVDNSLELDLYTGWAGDISGIGVDVGIIHYHFNGTNEANANEVYLGLSYGAATLTQYVGFDTGVEFTGDRDFGDYTNLALDLGSYQDFAFSGHVGYYRMDEGGDNYWDAKLAVATNMFGADWELSYTDTDQAADLGKLDDGRFILTLSKSL